MNAVVPHPLVDTVPLLVVRPYQPHVPAQRTAEEQNVEVAEALDDQIRSPVARPSGVEAVPEPSQGTSFTGCELSSPVVLLKELNGRTALTHESILIPGDEVLTGGVDVGLRAGIPRPGLAEYFVMPSRIETLSNTGVHVELKSGMRMDK